MRPIRSKPSIPRSARALRLKRPYVAVALALACPGAAIALPSGEQVVAGQVSVGRPNSRDLKVQQGSPSAIVNWRGFSIAGNESVSFQQPSVSSVILNRILGGNPSEIYGRLSANGQVFLVNPSGVLFGRGASVDVGGLVASTLGISNEDFLAGRYRFAAEGAAGKVENLGVLQARERGTVALLGGQVSNEGTITARLGTAAAAAGNKVTLDFAGDGLTRITVDEAAVGAQIQNQGIVVADGGQAVLTARAANALTETVVNQSGVVRARSLVERDGRIVLDGGETGATIVRGTLDASGTRSGGKGGTIQVLGHHVGVIDRALLDVRGDAGGGSVLMGGDYQGKNAAVRNAEATYFGREATIRADALAGGDGGKVIVWGNEAVRVHGTISAPGGKAGGNGGFIETSGKFLDAAGARVDASASAGVSGKWLVDPLNISIVPVGSVATGSVSPSPVFTSTAPSATLTDADVEAALNSGTSVTISTGAAVGAQPGNVAFESRLVGGVATAATVDKTAGGDATLRVNAHNDITMVPGTRIASSSGRLNVEFNSDSDALGGGAIALTGATIASNGGSVSLFGQSNVASGRAVGDPNGVTFTTAVIDTRIGQTPGTPSGSIVIRGEGAALAGSGPFRGVSLSGSRLIASSSSITLDGISPDEGVIVGSVAGNPAISTESGNIDILGVATGVGAGFGPTGVFMGSPTISTTAGGSINIRGRASGAASIGVDSDDAVVTTSGIGAGTITVSGESTAASLGVRLGGVSRLGGPSTSGNIIVRATNAGDADSIQLGGTIRTTGVIDLRPGGVAASGALTAADADNIEIVAFGTGAAGFVLDTLELLSLTGGAAQVVIGGSTHAGPITVSSAASFVDNVTLQNAGGGSNGIAVNGALGSPGHSITLSSAGPVTQTAPITAASLLLHGTGPGSNFVLLNAANAASQFAANTPFGGGVQFRNGQALTIGPLSSIGFDSLSNSPVAIGMANTVSFGDFLAQTLAGNLNLGHNITTLASNIDLVSAGIFNNFGGGLLTPGGTGRFRVWADNFVGENRGGLVGTSPFPNIYGCTYPGVCAPGVAIPATGNRFIYAQRPSVIVTVDNKTRGFLFPNPPFTFSTAGLVNGDTSGDAVAGSITTSATQTSPVGAYPLVGAFASPVGYVLSTINGTLTVTPFDITEIPGRSDVITTSQSYLYDRNLGIANMCIASGPMVVEKAARTGDRLETEWSRVRQRPNLSNCIELDERNTCFDF